MRKLILMWVAVSLLGCGRAEQVQAVRDPVVPVELREFRAEDWRLANNKFFLWKENLTPEQVSRAKDIADTIDLLDTQAVPLNRERFQLEERIDPLKDDVRLLSRQHRSWKRVVGKTRASLKKAEAALKKLESSLEEERTRPQPDADTVRSLELEIAVAKATIETLEEQLEEVEPLEAEAREQLESIEAELAPLEERMEALEAQQLEIELKGRQKVDEIMQVVEWYKDQPASVVFQFQKDGTIAASIDGWNLGDDMGPRRLSTVPGVNGVATIRNVTYTELGGVFTFVVLIYEDPSKNEKLRETYFFKISRTNYDAEDGRRFFSGEITRTRRTPAGLEVRKGVAKLVDRYN